MNRKEFLEEVKQKGFYSSEFEESYKVFSSFQLKIFDTLKAFHQVCEKNNINYQLAYGSLLGIIRDGGQIPWDYDIDVFVPFYERERLVGALEEELGSDYELQALEVNEHWRSFMMRIAPKGYSTECLHVDIFFYIAAPNDSEERKKFASRVQSLALKHYYKLIRITDARRTWTGVLKLFLLKLLYLPISYKQIRREFYDLCYKYNINEVDYYISSDIFATWYDFPAKLLLETELIKTEAGEFRISRYYDELLTLIYRDYKRIPPLEERLREIEKHYENFRNL